MPTTYPGVRPELIGDTDTIRKRLDDSRYDCAAVVRCCAHRIRSSGEVGDYFTDDLLETGERNHALLAESIRRNRAYELAHPRGLA